MAYKTIPSALIQEGDVLKGDLVVLKVTKRESLMLIETRRGTKAFPNNHNVRIFRPPLKEIE